MFALKKHDLPAALIVDNSVEGDLPAKYKLTSNFSENNLVYFINNWSTQKLTPFYKSQPIPDKQEGIITEIVGLNFNETVVNDKTTDALVFFYDASPDCKKCIEMESIIKQMASKLLDERKSLRFFKFEGIENEVPNMFVSESFPVLMLWTREKKDKPYIYNREIFDYQEVMKWLNNNFAEEQAEKKTEL